MPISATDLEAAIRAAMPVTYLEIEDTSNGCGENYSVFVVSAVRIFQIFGGKNHEPSLNANVWDTPSCDIGFRREEHARKTPLQ